MKKFKDWKRSSQIVVPILLTLFTLVASVGIQFAVNMGIQKISDAPSGDYDAGGCDRLVYYCYLDKENRDTELDELGVELTETYIQEQLVGSYSYIDGRYDCADFRVNSLIRLYLTYSEYLNEAEEARIKDCLLGFKYWMDEGGEDSMCAWSENHQILFAVEEYLVGQMFPNEVFAVDGKTGLVHMEYAEERINAWMELRYSYGFSEWYSNNYYPEDIGAMANLIQFCNNETLVNRMKIIMDIIWLDVATQSFKYEGIDADGVTPRTYYIFNSSSGRMYSDNRMSDDNGNRLRRYTDYVLQPNETKDFANSWYTSNNGFFNAFKQMYEALDDNDEPYYTVPNAIKEIFFDDPDEKIIKSTQSLDVEELAGEGLVGQENKQIMFQMGMEAFSNPEIIDNSIKYLNDNNMFSNAFLNDFKLVNLWPLTSTNSLGGLSKILHPATDGKAIERANVYTYKTDNYSMHTAQAHQAGEYTDQQAISNVNLSNEVSVFTTQPAKIARRSGTPTYWVGNGRQPYSVQEKNLNITIYNPPTSKGMLEPMIIEKTTHVFFPTQLFDEYDETMTDDGYIFGREGDSYIAIKSRYAMEFKSFAESDDTAGENNSNRDNMLVRGSVGDVLTEKYDLVQYGDDYHYYITEVSSSDVETFADFKTRFIANIDDSLEYANGSVEYKTILNGETSLSTFDVVYDDSFKINNTLIDLQYDRYENSYVTNGAIQRKPEEIKFTCNNRQLTLNYNLNTRVLATI